MPLSEHLCKETVCMGLEANERDEALRELLDTLVERGQLEAQQVEPSLEALLAREKLGSTALGKGLAVPHARVDGLGRIIVAFGYSRAGISFNSLDGQPVKYLFLVVAPEEEHQEYVALMGSISQLVRDGDFRRFLVATREREDIVDLVREMEE